MKRNEIESKVNEMVFGNYDCSTGTLDIEVPLTDAIIATVTKKQGSSPVCEIYDYDIEGDKELYLPNVCTFIEEVTEQAVNEYIEQHEFEGYDDEAPVTLTRDELRWNHRRFNW